MFAIVFGVIHAGACGCAHASQMYVCMFLFCVYVCVYIGMYLHTYMFVLVGMFYSGHVHMLETMELCLSCMILSFHNVNE